MNREEDLISRAVAGLTHSIALMQLVGMDKEQAARTIAECLDTAYEKPIFPAVRKGDEA